MKYLSILFCFLIASCAGYKDIKPGSAEYYGLKKGDILWVHTGIMARKKVELVKIEGDSLFADPYSFSIDSITGIQKEYDSRANTGIVAGGASVLMVGFVVVSLVALLSFYVKVMVLL